MNEEAFRTPPGGEDPRPHQRVVGHIDVPCVVHIELVMPGVGFEPGTSRLRAPRIDDRCWQFIRESKPIPTRMFFSIQNAAPHGDIIRLPLFGEIALSLFPPIYPIWFGGR